MAATNPVVQTYIPEQLSAGNFPVVTDAVTIGLNQTLKAGSVLGKDAAGDYVLSLAAAEDTSKVPTVICAEAITTTDAKAVGIVRLTGEALGSQLDIGAGHTLESVKAALRPLSIFVR